MALVLDTVQLVGVGGKATTMQVLRDTITGAVSPAHVLMIAGAPVGPGNPLVLGATPRVTAELVRAADATAYAIGDLIANSTTAASVVPITFTAARTVGGTGRISGCSCVLTAGSGTIVLPSFDLILFRSEPNIPFAAGGYPADNAALNLSSAQMQQIVAVLPFSSSAWRNQAGGATAAGPVGYQAVAVPGRAYAPFNLASNGNQTLLGLLQAQSAWAPGNVAQTFDFALDVDQD